MKIFYAKNRVFFLTYTKISVIMSDKEDKQMAKYCVEYRMSDRDAILLTRKAVSKKFAILKDKGNFLKVGAPMMKAMIEIGNGKIQINGKLFGKIVASTCYSAISTEIQLAER